MLKPRISSMLARKREEGVKITQTEIAKTLGVTRQQVNWWVTGKRTPRLETAFELADIIGCRVDDLFEYTKKRIGDGL
ncbi:helix-turn-helix transcriptional regulator [Desmospora activa]|nr:helix-turn-helix transcriptional regulator [Desmospora activa]